MRTREQEHNTTYYVFCLKMYSMQGLQRQVVYCFIASTETMIMTLIARKLIMNHKRHVCMEL